nr:unnamed protein product [Callosobruchus chinensis]
MCHLQSLSHRRAVGGLSLFYRYSNEFCSSELTSIVPPLPCSLDALRDFFISPHTSRTERYDRTFVPRISRT